jgi:hypothetical protein
VQLVDFAVERSQEELHQRADFALRPVPVLARKSEQRQRLDALAPAEFHRGTHRLLALAVAEAARTVPLLRPAAVAVHDDRDVAWNARCGIGFHADLRRSGFSREASLFDAKTAAEAAPTPTSPSIRLP